ncbi:unnamed protein product [Polarella glacialis]|uniref:Uncharacterized protein n=1 Tax=Polarella glacialis TaxID=89957 RepID=A0A813D2F7_POLGL|nr:unnamed protein product [Polarella glacialis]CAE8696541.1 unnamed protein product [Polarella glacialis]
MCVFVTGTILSLCAVSITGQIYKMPTLMSVPLSLTFGLILLSGPACCKYVYCWFSFCMHGGSSSNQEAGQGASQEANQEPGEHESTEETHLEEGDCEHVLEPRETQGATCINIMNIVAPRPKADEPSLIKTQEAIILGNAMVSPRPLPASHPAPLSLSLSCYCCEQVLVDSSIAK